MRLWVYILALVITSAAQAGELVHSFNSPSFTGVGYSSHVLTIEQLQIQGQQKQKDKQAQELAAQERARLTNPVNQFVGNLQSIVYQQLAKRLSEAIFGENPSNSGSISLGGNVIAYARVGNDINLTVVDTYGSTTQVTIPVGSIAF